MHPGTWESQRGRRRGHYRPWLITLIAGGHTHTMTLARVRFPSGFGGALFIMATSSATNDRQP
eukprot:2784732-Lingulodinium_polyedra.AAC.1